MFHEHKQKAEITHFVESHTCAACLQFFGTRIRAINHVKKSRRCKLYHLANLNRMNDEEYAAHVIQDRIRASKLSKEGNRSYVVEEGEKAIRLPGPYTKCCEMFGIRHRTCLKERWDEQFLQL